MERSEAIKLSLPRYTTGRPCKNGHLAYRYTQSGTCSECINPNNGSKPHMAELRVRVFDKHLHELTTAVHLAAMLRYPKVTISHITCNGRRSSVVNGTSIRYFRVHEDDYETLNQLALSMFKEESSRQFSMRRN